VKEIHTRTKILYSTSTPKEEMTRAAFGRKLGLKWTHAEWSHPKSPLNPDKQSGHQRRTSRRSLKCLGSAVRNRGLSIARDWSLVESHVASASHLLIFPFAAVSNSNRGVAGDHTQRARFLLGVLPCLPWEAPRSPIRVRAVSTGLKLFRSDIYLQNMRCERMQSWIEGHLVWFC